MPYCHVSQTFKGSPDLQGLITFTVVLAMVALGIVALGLTVIGLHMLLS